MVFGLDDGLYFASAHQLAPQIGKQIPASMIGRLLREGDLRRLQRAIKPTEPSVPSRTVERRTAGKR